MALPSIMRLHPPHTGRPRTRREVAAFVRETCVHQTGLLGLVTRLRPWICPFEEVLARIPAGGSVLDVGCGTGIMSALTARYAEPRSVEGMDVSAQAICLAQRMCLDAPAQMTFQVLPPFEFPTRQYDVVLCVDVLHHVPPARQEEFLQALQDRLTPGGTLIVKDISPRPLWKACANRLHDLLMARQWVHHRAEEDVERVLAQRTGRVQERTRIDRLWYSHYLVVWREGESTTPRRRSAMQTSSDRRHS